MTKKALLLLTLISLPQPQLGREFLLARAAPLSVLINEIAWMGGQKSFNDEWIELYNPLSFSVNLEGWSIRAADGTPVIELEGEIPAQGFYLLERSDDDTVPGIPSDLIYTGALGNAGEDLALYDSKGLLIDSVSCASGWPAGENSAKKTMERTEEGGWQTSREASGTPKSQNSIREKTAENESLRTEKTSLSPTDTTRPLIFPLALSLFSAASIVILKNSLKKGYNIGV